MFRRTIRVVAVKVCIGVTVNQELAELAICLLVLFKIGYADPVVVGDECHRTRRHGSGHAEKSEKRSHEASYFVSVFHFFLLSRIMYIFLS